MSKFEVDYPDRTTSVHSNLEDATAAAQKHIAETSAISLRVFQNDKAVALVQASLIQTLQTDPGF